MKGNKMTNSRFNKLLGLFLLRKMHGKVVQS